jgi:hypothetical protein
MMASQKVLPNNLSHKPAHQHQEQDNQGSFLNIIQNEEETY